HEADGATDTLHAGHRSRRSARGPCERTLVEWLVVRYRVEQLAPRCDVSVDTVRYYQTLGLLPGPVREGRVAWYGVEHAEKIRGVAPPQRKGLTLAAIRRVVQGALGPADADLAAAVSAARGADGPDELL